MQTCGLCFNEYAPRMRVPKLLPCGHDFCQSCLEQLVACTKSAKCPACRQPLPSGVAIDNLPTVFKLMEAAPATSDGEPSSAGREEAASPPAGPTAGATPSIADDDDIQQLIHDLLASAERRPSNAWDVPRHRQDDRPTASESASSHRQAWSGMQDYFRATIKWVFGPAPAARTDRRSSPDGLRRALVACFRKPGYALLSVLDGCFLVWTAASFVPFLPPPFPALLYHKALTVVAWVSAIRVGAQVGFPTFTAPGAKAWLAKTMATREAYHLLAALVFIFLARWVHFHIFLLSPAILAHLHMLSSLQSLLGPELFASTPLARIERETTPRLERLQTLQVVAELAGAFLLPAYAVFYRSLCYALAAFAYLNVLRLMYYARGCADHRKAWSALWRWCRPISGIPGVATAVDAYWQWFVALRVIPTANE